MWYLILSFPDLAVFLTSNDYVHQKTYLLRGILIPKYICTGDPHSCLFIKSYFFLETYLVISVGIISDKNTVCTI